jgi:hypothetical protein
MRTVQKRSKAKEQALAKQHGGVRQPGSGNTWSRKGDVTVPRSSDDGPDYLFEHKYTDKQSYSLKATDLENHEEHAVMEGRVGVFVIELNGRNWYVLSEVDFNDRT